MNIYLLISEIIDKFFSLCSEPVLFTNSAVICFGILGFTFGLNKILNLETIAFKSEDSAYTKLALNNRLEKETHKLRMKFLELLSISFISLMFILFGFILGFIPSVKSIFLFMAFLLTLHSLGLAFSIIKTFTTYLEKWENMRKQIKIKEEEYGEEDIEKFKSLDRIFREQS